MSFTPRTWVNGQLVDAADANRWEQGIADAVAGSALDDAELAAVIESPATVTRGALDDLYADSGFVDTIAVPSKNLVDASKGQDGYYWNNGQSTPYPLVGYWASDLIAVSPGQQITVQGARVLQFFNAAKGWVNGYLYINDSTYSNHTVTVPVGQPWMAVATTIDRKPIVQVEVGAVATAYEKYGVLASRLLVPGGYLSDVITSLTGSVFVRSTLRVFRSGGTILVRSRFDGTKDVLMPFSLSSGVNSMVQFTTASHSYPMLVPTATTDVQIWPVLNVAVISMQDPSDDNTPIQSNGYYIGGNHGWPGACNLTAAAHGKTNADRGSQWSTPDGTYTLLRVVDANTLLLAYPYTVSGGSVTPYWSQPRATLTHVSGATNTAAIPITGGMTTVQLAPSTHSHVVEVRIDGSPLADGISIGDVVTITESYTIASFKAIVDWARANIGSDTLSQDMSGWAKLARISNTYRITPATTVVTQTVRMLDEGTSLNMGGVQAFPLMLPSGGSRVQFMAGVGTAGGVNFSTYANLAELTGTTTVNLAAQLNTGDPAQRMTQWALNSSGVRQYGMTMGLLPAMDSKNATRKTNGTDTTSWFIPTSTYKNYPQVAWGKPLSAGQSITSIGYRRYLPADAAPDQVITDGSRYWLTIDQPTANTTPQIARVPTIVGRALTTVGTATVVKDSPYVTGAGVTYTNPAPGYLLAEAVIDVLV